MMSTPAAISPYAALLVVTALLFLALPGSARPPSAGGEGDAARSRLLVLTDISSLTPGLREPDDGQSMIRLMLYANEFDLEGLIASSNLVHGQNVRPELIREVVESYAAVQPNLRLHDPRYPPADRLRRLIKSGQPAAGLKTPVFDSIGDGKDTDASDWIIRVVDRRDSRPVWVTVWGGSADLAQALWHVRQHRAAEEVSHFVSRLRLHLIGDQDSTGPWIRESFPDLFTITRSFGYRGMYRGGDPSLVSPEWVEQHVRTGHGALGALYPNYNGGDIWSSRLGTVRGIKEGDTPSFLSLVPNGLSDPEHPEWGSWGGRCTPTGPRRFSDAVDPSTAAPSDPDPRISTVYRWRSAFQADFQARLDWCVKAVANANHPPVPRLRGAPRGEVRAGESVTLDAGASADPDGDRLTFGWSIYPEPVGEPRDFALPEPHGSRIRFRAPAVSSRTVLPLLLTVTDSGTPPLSRYRRVMLTISAP